MPAEETTDPNIIVDAMPVTEKRCRERMEKQTTKICAKIDTLKTPVETLMEAYNEEKGRRAGRAEVQKETRGKLTLNARLIGITVILIAGLISIMLWLTSERVDPEVQATATAKAVVEALREIP